MLFTEAKRLLKALAKLRNKGKNHYHSICYELTEYADGTQDVVCQVYIAGLPHHYYDNTWEGALSQIERLVKKTQPNLREAPGQEGGIKA